MKKKNPTIIKIVDTIKSNKNELFPKLNRTLQISLKRESPSKKRKRSIATTHSFITWSPQDLTNCFKAFPICAPRLQKKHKNHCQSNNSTITILFQQTHFDNAHERDDTNPTLTILLPTDIKPR